MKLYEKSLKKLISGACYYKMDGAYLYPYHFSEAQLEHFKQRDDFWYSRALLQAGIKIELVTDSEKLGMEYYSYAVYSAIDGINVCVNDVAVYTHNPGKPGKGSFECTLPKGEKRVTVYLPIDAPVGIKSLYVDGKYKAAKERKTKLLAIGDSITQGYGAGVGYATYVNSLYRKTGYEILCQGIGGYRYEKGSVMPIDGYKPDKIMVALGTNYYNDPAYDYEKCIEEFYEALHSVYGDTPVLTVTPIWRYDEGFDEGRLMLVSEKIKSVCSKYSNITVLDGYYLVPHIEECYLDPVHPNAYGNEHMAQGIFSFMKKIKF